MEIGTILGGLYVLDLAEFTRTTRDGDVVEGVWVEGVLAFGDDEPKLVRIKVDDVSVRGIVYYNGIQVKYAVGETD